MAVALSLTLAILPALLLLVYFNRWDKRKPEPKRLILKIFVLGFAIIFPAMFIELGIDWAMVRTVPDVLFVHALITAFVIAAVTEEWLKFQVVRRFAYRNVAFDEVMDGIVYAIVAGLGFACLENVFYVLNSGWSTAVFRAVTAVPGHALWSGIMGYYIGLAKFAGSPGLERKYLRKGLFMGILFHGLYDFCVFAIPDAQTLVGEIGVLVAFGIFPVLLYGFVRLRGNMKTAIAADVAAGRVVPDAAGPAPAAGPPAGDAQGT